MPVQGNTIQFKVAAQVSPSSGVPSTPEWLPVRRVDGDIDRTSTFVQSAETDDTRQAAESILTELAVGGTMNMEFPLADAGLRLFIESAMQGRFGSDVGVADSTISFDNASSEIRDSGNGFVNVVAGQYIGVFDSASQVDEVFYVTSKTDDGTLVVSPAPVDEAAGATITVSGQNMRNGKQELGLAMQKRIVADDGGIDYRTMEGLQSNTFSLSVTTGALLVASIGLIGLKKLDQTTAITGQTDAASQPDSVIGSVSGVPTVFYNNVKSDIEGKCYTDMSIEIDNGGSGFYCIGGTGATGLQYGSISANGTLNSLVDSTSVATIRAEKELEENQTEFSLGMVFEDKNKNKLVIHRPNCQYTALPQAETGNGTLLTNAGTISAHGKGTSGYTVQITYIAAP